MNLDKLLGSTYITFFFISMFVYLTQVICIAEKNGNWPISHKIHLYCDQWGMHVPVLALPKELLSSTFEKL